jgi:hypothetical protein
MGGLAEAGYWFVSMILTAVILSEEKENRSGGFMTVKYEVVVVVKKGVKGKEEEVEEEN